MTSKSDLRDQPVAQPEPSSGGPAKDEEVAETSEPAKAPETKEPARDVPQPGLRPTRAAGRPASRHDFQLKALPTLTGVVMIACLWPQGIPNVIVDTISDYVWLPVHG